MSSFSKVVRRYLLLSAVLALLAYVAFQWLAPLGIRLVHSGAIPFLGGLISGRESVPVETYLGMWFDLSGPFAYVVAQAWFLGFLILTLGWHTSAAHRDGSASERAFFAAGPSASGSEPDAEVPAEAEARVEAGARLEPLTRRSLRYALWFALVGGLGEGLYLISKYLFFRKFPMEFPEVSEHAVWMTTLDHVLVAGLVWVLLVGIGAALPLLRRAGLLAGAFPTLVLLSWFGAAGRIAPWAAALLCLGIAYQLVERRPLSAPALDSLMRRTTIPLVIAVLGLGFALPAYRVFDEWRAAEALPPAPEQAPNVLFVVFDTQRALNMGLYGYERNTTPHVDALATESVVFDQAFSTAPWTLPSHSSMFTGRWPHELRADFLVPLDDTYPMVQELLADRGYRTGGFPANLAFVTRMYGLSRGFQRFHGPKPTASLVLKHAWITRWPWLRIRKDVLGLSGYVLNTPATQVNRWFLDWEEQLDGRPFFAFLNYMEPHEPYTPPEPFYGRFGPAGDLSWFSKGPESDAYTAEELAELMARYDEDIAASDAAFGDLLEELRARGTLDNTIVIVTSDHGDEFGEHGWLDHIYTVYRTTTHVPLVIRLPDGAHAGERVPGPVTTRDLANTVLDLTGLEPSLPGATLARYFGVADTANVPDPGLILTELGRTRALTEGDWRYVWAPREGEEELFDVWSDRYDLEDLKERRPADRDQLLRTLREVFPDVGPDGEPLPDGTGRSGG